MWKLVRDKINARGFRVLIGCLSILSLLLSYNGLLNDGIRYAAYHFLESKEVNYFSIACFSLMSLFMIIKPQRITAILFVISSCLFISADLNRFNPLMLVCISFLFVSEKATTQYRTIVRWTLVIFFSFLLLNRINNSYEYALHELLLDISLSELSNYVLYFLIGSQIILLILLISFSDKKLTNGVLLFNIILLSFLCVIGRDLYSLVWCVPIFFFALIFISSSDNNHEIIIEEQFMVFILFLICLVSYLGFINKAFSFAFYSGREEDGVLIIKESKVSVLPKYFRESIYKLKEHDYEPVVFIGKTRKVYYNQWLYPAPRNVIRQVQPLRGGKVESQDVLLLVKTEEQQFEGLNIAPVLLNDFK